MSEYLKNLHYRIVLVAVAVILSSGIQAQEEDTDSLNRDHEMKSIEVKATTGTRSKSRTENVDLIGQSQLVRAACCNLGESFTTNPSVDVSYSDAATGAKQIKLLGLSGTYVQMLTENVPTLRGAALPYSLGYVPGPWMQSIQVSKGASSVKNGYESTTGQINIEYLKPQGTDGVRANAYQDSELKTEVNADGSIHLNDKLSTSALLHFENRQMDHDGNGDGFMDMPKLRQYNLMHRWSYVSSGWISQLAARILKDERESGQSEKHFNANQNPNVKRYEASVKTNRYETQWKNGFPFNDGHNTSIALMMHGSWHDAWNRFGYTQLDVTQKNGYAQLMFETDFTDQHNLSVGTSVNYDWYDEYYCINNPIYKGLPSLGGITTETTPGVYAQYTYKLDDKLTVMPGIRWDHSNIYGGFFTPRLHVKYSPYDVLTLRASAGKGYRSPHPLSENSPMFVSGRHAMITGPLKQEEAWNYGVSAGMNFLVAGKNLEVNMEYYYTRFINQLVAIYEDNWFNQNTGSSITSLILPRYINFVNLDYNGTGNKHAQSYSHTFQVDATYPFFEGFTATAAFRLNDVKYTYKSVLRRKPLTSRYKGLLTMSYSTPFDIWKFDVTGQLNGDGELYDYTKYPTYFQLQAQVTREFEHFSIYAGGENLTNNKIKEPIIGAHNPWSSEFDATQVWGPVTGAMAYIGVRIKFEKL